MKLEKLKPWNWFKHEDDASNQVPISKVTIEKNANFDHETNTPALGSLFQMQSEMDRLFDKLWRSIGMPTNFGSEYSNSNPFKKFEQDNYRAKLDVSGSDSEYEVAVDVPGFSDKDLTIDLRGNVLTIKGEKEHKTESKDKHYYRIERSMGTIQRTLTLPDDADSDGISAELKNGLLMLHIPRRSLPKEQVKRISIAS